MTKSKKKLLAYASLAMLGVGALTGCGNKENTTSNDNVVKTEAINTESENTALLQGTLLDGTVIAVIDGDVMIVRPIYYKEDGFFDFNHIHYYNISNNVLYTEYESACQDHLENYQTKLHFVHVNILCETTNILTEEEINKAIHGELTEDDVAAIVFRVNQEEQKKLELK